MPPKGLELTALPRGELAALAEMECACGCTASVRGLDASGSLMSGTVHSHKRCAELAQRALPRRVSARVDQMTDVCMLHVPLTVEANKACKRRCVSQLLLPRNLQCH
jgi:hypothetical protein